MKIAVALSGGVDSAVAAALLLSEGHEIIGVTMKHYDPQKSGFPDDDGIDAAIIDAEIVCDKLNIKHYVFDVQEEFEKIIINNFIEEYKLGRTPNPCTLCNSTIKWGTLLDKVMLLGVDKIATGHYLKLLKIDNKLHLFRADDREKDQTYMLWRLNQSHLEKTIFPLYKHSKTEIREIADKLDLHIASKKDSQEICFISGSYQEFLKKHFKQTPGDILFKNGVKIGEHKGIANYTIGQRRGLNTPWKSALFVCEIDVARNTVIVTDDNDDLLSSHFMIKDVNWIIGEPPLKYAQIEVQIRYNSRSQPIFNLIECSACYEVKLLRPIRAVTAGQSAVFYLGNELLGGGIIEQVFKSKTNFSN